MNYLRLLFIMTLNLWLFCQPSSSMAFTHCNYGVVGVQSNDTLSVRSGAGITYKIINDIPSNGTDIEIVGNAVWIGTSSWVPIEYNGISGWVNRSYLKTACPTGMYCFYRVINVHYNDRLSVRKRAGVKYKKIYSLAANARDIELTGISKKLNRFLWVQIKHNGITGWVNKYYLEMDCDDY